MIDGLAVREVRELVVRAQRADRAAFAELVRLHLRAVYVIAIAQLGRVADAEDAAQDACVQALLRIGDCREPERFSSWFLTIARNVARDLRDRRRLRDVPVDDAPALSATEPLDAAHRDLLRALEHLSESEREVLLLADLEGWSHREIADGLGISEVGSRQIAFVARRKMRERLGGHR